MNPPVPKNQILDPEIKKKDDSRRDLQLESAKAIRQLRFESAKVLYLCKYFLPKKKSVPYRAPPCGVIRPPKTPYPEGPDPHGTPR